MQEPGIPPDALNRLEQTFASLFGGSPRIYRAPGRVNLIGEHTDYTGGFVMPAAIDLFTYVASSQRRDRKLVVRSENLQEQMEVSLDTLPERGKRHWSDYVVGVAKALQELGYRLSGVNLLVEGNVPLGAGLSSSASLEVAVATALRDLFEIPLPSKDLALLCQRAENEFVGARCGIMDQFIAVHGASDRALLLDCRSLEYHLLPLLRDVRLVICNTMVRHEIAHGEYNLRRSQCEQGTRMLAQHISGLRSLRDVSEADFAELNDGLPELIRRRCRHVITENARVLRAAQALEGRDMVKFGELMRMSHESLRDDFEVSCAELDLMVDLAGNLPGVYGSRMTGGGFGGCTVNLVREECTVPFGQIVREEYTKGIGVEPDIYVCSTADGAGKVR